MPGSMALQRKTIFLENRERGLVLSLNLVVATATLCAQASGAGDALPGDALHCREFFLGAGIYM